MIRIYRLRLGLDFIGFDRPNGQFRTALVGIEGFSELISDSDHLELEEVGAFAKDIHDDAERLDGAFEKMLDQVVNEVVKVTRD